MYVTSRPVEQPPPRLVSLLDLVTQDIDYRYTDIAKVLEIYLFISFSSLHISISLLYEAVN